MKWPVKTKVEINAFYNNDANILRTKNTESGEAELKNVGDKYQYKNKIILHNNIINVVSFPWVLQEVICPVSGCLAVEHSAGRLRDHFMYHHLRSKVEVVQEGKEPLPRCDSCGMHMPEGRLTRHRKKARCDKNTQMRWRRLDVEITARCLEATFSLTGEEEA